MQNDALKELLMNREAMPIAPSPAKLVQGPLAPSGLPAPPPNVKQHEAPALQRYLTALKMQSAIASGWKTSPTLVKILSDER